jgi:hypothetical protein
MGTIDIIDIKDLWNPQEFIYNGIEYVVNKSGYPRIHYKNGGLWGPFPDLPKHIMDNLFVYFQLELDKSIKLQEYLDLLQTSERML